VNKKFVIDDMQAALLRQEYPSVTAWNRLEVRPRMHNFERALKAEVRDALWMLTRQWQMGEFNGDDAASLIGTKLYVSTNSLTQYQSAGQSSPEEFREDIPLEAHVERLSIPFVQLEPLIEDQKVKITEHMLSLDIRLLMGRQWLKLLKTISKDLADQQAYITKYGIDPPSPGRNEDRQICAHPEVWANMAAVAGRCMDGAKLFFYLASGTAASPHLATDEISLADTGQKGSIDELGQRFQAWFQQLFYQPSSPHSDAWLPERLEYQFDLSTTGGQGEEVLHAEEYYQGRLDWYAFDVDPVPAEGRELDSSESDGAMQPVIQSVVPTQVVFDGAPNTRWWTFEDRRTNLGSIQPDLTDIAKLMLLEFGLVYANDWFLVPQTLPVGVVAQVQGISVTNVFGERFWIEPASGRSDAAGKQWSLFTLSQQGTMGESADRSLVLLPTVPKIQEGKPREQVVFIRDEVSNMVWGIEKIIPLASGESKSGSESAIELRAFLQKPLIAIIEKLKSRRAQLENIPASSRSPSDADELAYIDSELEKLFPAPAAADIRYQVMNTIPEHWIPFIPVHVDKNNREIQLQRASLPRILKGDPDAPKKVRPRTSLLRPGLDQSSPLAYYLHEEEVPRAGIQVTQSFQRTRWKDGHVWVWLGIQKQIGRGEGSSGLAFDQLISKSKA
jgi:hypothetical protein